MPTKKEAQDFDVIVPFIAKTGQAIANEGIVTIGKPKAVYINGSDTFVDFWSQLGTYTNSNNNQCYTGSGAIPDPLVGNVAGFHIHAGSSCGTKEEQEGHYFKNKDNWQAARYGSGQKFGWGSHIDIGYEWHTIANRVVIVHNGDGERVWCGKLYFKCNKGPWTKGDSSNSKCDSCKDISEAKGEDYKCLQLVSGNAKKASRNSPTVCCPPDQVEKSKNWWGKDVKVCRDNAHPDTQGQESEEDGFDEEDRRLDENFDDDDEDLEPKVLV
jgi:hypothetical protein